MRFYFIINTDRAGRFVMFDSVCTQKWSSFKTKNVSWIFWVWSFQFYLLLFVILIKISIFYYTLIAHNFKVLCNYLKLYCYLVLRHYIVISRRHYFAKISHSFKIAWPYYDMKILFCYFKITPAFLPLNLAQGFCNTGKI